MTSASVIDPLVDLNEGEITASLEASFINRSQEEG